MKRDVKVLLTFKLPQLLSPTSDLVKQAQHSRAGQGESRKVAPGLGTVLRKRVAWKKAL